MSDEKAPGRGYKPPPPISESLVNGPCGAAQFPDSQYKFPCVLPKGHVGSHRDEEGDEFARGYVKLENGSYVQESLPIDEKLVYGPPEDGRPAMTQLPPAHCVPLIDYSHELPDRATLVPLRTDTVNNYKQDAGKPPLMQAVLIPFGKTLLDLAAMMEDMKHKHKLEGAKDPFQEWRQLPGGKWRLADAGARHAVVNPFGVNTKDGKHLHILHAIWSLMAAYEKHLEENA